MLEGRKLAVREAEAEARVAREDAAEREARDGHRRLRRHAHQPREPVVARRASAAHVPRVHEHRRVQRLRRLLERVGRR